MNVDRSRIARRRIRDRKGNELALAAAKKSVRTGGIDITADDLALSIHPFRKRADSLRSIDHRDFSIGSAQETMDFVEIDSVGRSDNLTLLVNSRGGGNDLSRSIEGSEDSIRGTHEAMLVDRTLVVVAGDYAPGIAGCNKRPLGFRRINSFDRTVRGPDKTVRNIVFVVEGTDDGAIRLDAHGFRFS